MSLRDIFYGIGDALNWIWNFNLMNLLAAFTLLWVIGSLFWFVGLYSYLHDKENLSNSTSIMISALVTFIIFFVLLSGWFRIFFNIDLLTYLS
tara:strand:- start:302 stop:580 length:279 start_codon:yes stop_codon:yes gene_type:complete